MLKDKIKNEIKNEIKNMEQQKGNLNRVLLQEKQNI